MRRVLLALVPTFLLLIDGCADVFGQKDPHAPGDPVGRYQLSANVDAASSCAEAAAAAPRPWTFEVTLRKDGHTAFWITSDTPVVGTVDDKGALAFHASNRLQIRPADKAKELGPCVVVRNDDFSGTLAGPPSTEAGVAAFTGTLKYSYAVEEGADCRDLVGPAGPDRKSPMFTTMPCDVHFAVAAKRVGDPKPSR